MLTAKGDDVDRLIGLELGADDYVPKPCPTRELAARIRAFLRRVGDSAASADAQDCVRVCPFALWPARRYAEWGGRELALTSTGFNLLEVLVRHAGRVVSKSELSELGLGRALARYDRCVDMHLSSIRHKLGAHALGRACIQPVRGFGYQFICQ